MESRNLLVREKFFAGRKWNQELDTFSQTAAVNSAVVPQVHTRRGHREQPDVETLSN